MYAWGTLHVDVNPSVLSSPSSFVITWRLRSRFLLSSVRILVNHLVRIRWMILHVFIFVSRPARFGRGSSLTFTSSSTSAPGGGSSGLSPSPESSAEATLCRGGPVYLSSPGPVPSCTTASADKAADDRSPSDLARWVRVCRWGVVDVRI